MGMRKEISKLACAYSKTTNLTGSILLELNQEFGEVQIVALQTLTTTDYLLLKEHMACEQSPGMGCFNLSDFSQTVQVQLDNIHHIIDKFSQMPKVPNWFSWFHWRWLVITGMLWLCNYTPIMLMCVRNLSSSLKPIHAEVTLQEDMSKK